MRGFDAWDRHTAAGMLAIMCATASLTMSALRYLMGVANLEQMREVSGIFASVFALIDVGVHYMTNINDRKISERMTVWQQILYALSLISTYHKWLLPHDRRDWREFRTRAILAAHGDVDLWKPRDTDEWAPTFLLEIGHAVIMSLCLYHISERTLATKRRLKRLLIGVAGVSAGIYAHSDGWANDQGLSLKKQDIPISELLTKGIQVEDGKVWGQTDLDAGKTLTEVLPAVADIVHILLKQFMFTSYSLPLPALVGGGNVGAIMHSLMRPNPFQMTKSVREDLAADSSNWALFPRVHYLIEKNKWWTQVRYFVSMLEPLMLAAYQNKRDGPPNTPLNVTINVPYVDDCVDDCWDVYTKGVDRFCNLQAKEAHLSNFNSIVNYTVRMVNPENTRVGATIEPSNSTGTNYQERFANVTQQSFLSAGQALKYTHRQVTELLQPHNALFWDHSQKMHSPAITNFTKEDDDCGPKPTSHGAMSFPKKDDSVTAMGAAAFVGATAALSVASTFY